MDESLQQWMLESQQGKSASFEKIYRELSPRILGMLVRMLKNRELLEIGGKARDF